MSEAVSSSSSSTTSRWWTHDVFLSFRGEDTRLKFTDYLYNALTDAGINTFRDDVKLRRGDDIAPELIRAINKSRISVVVFSENYADSSWCLEELAEIVDCRKTLHQILLPVFYDVDPSDVRKQSNRYAVFFSKHEERFASDLNKVNRWRAALTEAASISGWDLRNFADGYEEKFIKKIVEQILNELKIKYIHVANYPVGIDVRLKKLNKLMSVEDKNSIRILGICGMSGIGKTTLSKALFNQYFNCFRGKCFLANVRENSNSSPNGLVSLQEELISDVLKIKKIRISNEDRGINIIKERLSGIEVLLVLDDVDHIKQVNALAGRCDWFGLGSRIIITTRNKQLLKAFKVEEVYMVENDSLDEGESLELFSWHAFQQPYPPVKFVDYSKVAASYCGSLPLALEVVGSFLCGMEIPEWKDAIRKLKAIPHQDIQKKLRLSYDALNDDKEKNIFLDVSCFLVGMEKNLVVKILDGCGFFGESGLGVLISRCLVKIDIVTHRLMMHDLLRDMGREIVRESSTEKPEKRSRLWLQEEVYEVLTNCMGTKHIEGLALELPRSNNEELNAEAFVKMQNLRLLKLNYVHLTGNFEHLISKKLRWICWHGFPLESIPGNFYQGKLVAIDMRHSSLREAWRDSKCLENLKVLNLSHSHMLMKSPDFSKLPILEELKLKNCTSLSELHQSIGELGKLYLINMEGCTNLKKLPRSIYKLKSLQSLNIVDCSKIEKLHEEIGELESLITLLADRTGIRQIPYSIVKLKNLRNLSLFGCKSPGNSLPFNFLSWMIPKRNSTSLNFLPTSLQGLSSLTELDLGNCNLDAIPADLGSLSSLKELILEGNNFQSLPVKLNGLSNLTVLSVENCARLEFIPELPTNLSNFRATNCKSLVRVPDLSAFPKAPSLVLTNCEKLVEVSGLDKLECSTNIRMAGCSNLSSQFRTNLLKKWSGYGMASICLPGSEIPDYFDFYSSNPSLCFQIPKVDKIFLGMTVAVVYAFDSKSESWQEAPTVKMINKTKDLRYSYRIIGAHRDPTIHGDHTWLIKLPFSYGYVVDPQDHVEIQITTRDSNRVIEKCGVRLIYYETPGADADNSVAADENKDLDLGLQSDVRCSRSLSYNDSEFQVKVYSRPKSKYFVAILLLSFSMILISWYLKVY